MKKTVIGTCPVCASKLKVAKLHCHNCSTSIEGDFELDKFSYLSKEQKMFIEVFVKNRGNIKEIEKEMGISYPTVRRNLDQVIEALGYTTVPKADAVDKKSILDRLDKGEITSEEALELMQGEK
ncbi:DUF2089 domain-containing protein [Fusibacter sp. JL216-2]|uniref:DUF2089 domain-containing protein n=1 Tax=Fusibacter sp. JL216-2 TaxID=3071453 RepID=UPI003D325BB5